MKCAWKEGRIKIVPTDTYNFIFAKVHKTQTAADLTVGKLLLQFVRGFGYMITYVFTFHTTSNHQNASFYYILHAKDPEHSHLSPEKKLTSLLGAEYIRSNPSLVFATSGTL